MPKSFSTALLSVALPILLCCAIVAQPASATELPVVDMCSLKTSGYTNDLNDNGWLAALPERLAAGSVTCETQSAERLGEAGGRTYGLWTARFTDRHLGDDRTHYLAQVGEVDAAGKLSVVYRTSSTDESAEIAARLVAFESSTLLAVVTPTWHFFLREPEGFKEVFMRDGVGNPTESEVKAALPDGAVTPFELGDNGRPYYRGTFNFDAMAIDLPIAMASEIFPRRFADPYYDRPLMLRFPLAIKNGELVPTGGEVVSPDDVVAGGIGETPAAFGVPSDTQVCDAYVFLTDPDPNGIAVRALPEKSALTIATLPGAIPDNPDSLGAEAHVVGIKNGWFLIENAVHPEEAYGVSAAEAAPGAGSDIVRKAYAGRGWVHGSRLSTFIQSGTALRAGADPASKPVFDLGLTDETFVTVTGLSNCQGDALELSVKRSDGKTGTGWIGGGDHSRLCANQVTDCV